MQLANQNPLDDVLFVFESGSDFVFSLAGAETLEYDFTADDQADGFSSWEKSSSGQHQVIEIHNSCRSCSGGYSQLALNRFVAKRLLSQKPKFLLVSGLNGATLDLPQIAKLAGIPCALFLDPFTVPEGFEDPYFSQWLKSSMSACSAVYSDSEGVEWLDSALGESVVTLLEDQSQLLAIAAPLVKQEQAFSSFDYSLYELLLRDYPLLTNMQKSDVRHFAHCKSVLDVGCGAGIFLDLLRRENICAEGVERNQLVAEYGQAKGLHITIADALHFVDTCDTRFDGVYCSHFIEHLPVDLVQTLLEHLASCMVEEGTLVLAFPDPESIRSQLLGFWRDPEHVRFYHPDLVITLAASVGLELEWSSYHEQPHSVFPFPASPSDITLEAPSQPCDLTIGAKPLSMIDRVMAFFGLASAAQLKQLEAQLSKLTASLENQMHHRDTVLAQLERRTQDLWNVNQTWSWNDNVTLTFRKRV
ncbi:MAG: class I SAM-dependent methyltransferase [Pseudomonadales bacterium]